jgi:hypothetical protein
MRRLSLLILACSSIAGLAAFGCGALSDPNKSNENVSTISGALTGTSVPDGTRVALVWKTGTNNQVAVGADVPVAGGHFTMSLAPPPDAYFAPEDGRTYEEVSNNAIPPSSPVADSPAPAQGGSSGSGGAGARESKLTPKDVVSGQITKPLEIAVAGFVVYVDTNGNGKLDLSGQYASSTDQLLGGNNEILLAYLRGGGQLDYEKLRDKSGILPNHGFNLAWERGRWLPLDLVELKLTSNPQLPSAVCSSSVAYGSSGSSSSGGGATDTDPAGPSPYPSPGDPHVTCSPDGRSFTWTSLPSDCPPSPPPPVGLCAGSGYPEARPTCAGGGYGSSLMPGQTPPAGWPCKVTDADGGAASDSGPIIVDGGKAPDGG